ncbi:hypothetical protein LTS12_027697 [Elasticomyces elasticus]|nr:hypothetical protein LTS12_027697 [Elasticomyces elasticus]
MFCYETNFSVIEGDEIPIVGDRKQMPEDFLIHGYVWSQGYFPNDFFENAMTQDDGCSIEEPSVRVSRMHRCLWLARQLCEYFEYSRKGFALTALAQGHEKATPYNPFDLEDNSSGEDA